MNLDYQKISQIAKLYSSTQKCKLYYELELTVIAIAAILIFGISRITLLGSMVLMRRLWRKLLHLQLFQENQHLFNLVFGLYCIDALYLFYTTIRMVSTVTQILICYQLAITAFIQRKLNKQREFAVEYYLKVMILRALELAYICAIIYLEQSSTTVAIVLAICFVVQLLIIQLIHLINTKGEQLRHYAKGQSMWYKVPEKPIDNIIQWSPQQEQYPPTVNVLYDNNYYRLQNQYNTSPPEDLKVIFIQLLFYNLNKTKRTVGIIFVLLSLLTSFICTDSWLYNIMISLVFAHELRKK